MAVPEQTPYKEYVGNGVTTNFALEFTCDSKQELKVFINDIESELSTWSLVGGSVVFTTAPVSGSKIVLKRATKLERTTNYSSINNSFRPEAINKDLDRVWYAIQDQNYKAGQYDHDYNFVLTQVRPINIGGTGADNVVDARTNLEVYSQSEVNALIATGGASNVVGITGGGTGATTAEQARNNLSVYSKTETDTAIANATPNASGTVSGVVKLVNNLTSVDTDKALTAAQGKVLKDLVDTKQASSTAFGIGQTYQDVTASRSLNTTYTNTDSKARYIMVSCGGANTFIVATVGGVDLPAQNIGNNLSTTVGTYFVVPAGVTYKVTGGTLGKWAELKV